MNLERLADAVGSRDRLNEMLTERGYAPMDDPVLEAARAVLNSEEVWWCEAWENQAGVDEPCEAGSAHDHPDFDCHWRLILRLPEADV